MEKKQVMLLMGGMSSEHDVSIESGTKVAASLSREKYDVTPVTITREGVWRFPYEADRDIFDAVVRLKELRVDCVLIALHGAFGEDGRLQGMLDLLGIPYTSSGCAASALAIDKIRCKSVVRAAGVPVANHMILERAVWEEDPDRVVSDVEAELTFPCVIKSPCQGSSIGMAIPKDADEFRKKLPDIFEYGDVVMAEEFLRGTEVTCGVLDVAPEGDAYALPVTEIRPVSSAFFDYHAKYTAGASNEITPAEISPELTARVQEIAELAHLAVGCSIWSRSDFIIDEGGPVWIEINIVPGLTPLSLYPQAAAAAGIAYPELMDMFVEAAIARAGKKA